MIVEERTSNGGSMECTQLVPFAKSDAVNEFAFGSGSDFTDEIEISGTISVEGLRTYKRRKRLSSESDLQEDMKVSTVEAGQFADKITKESRCSSSYEQDFFSRLDRHAILDGSDNCSHGHWRNLVLEFLSRSLDMSEGGIQSCIRDARAFSPIGFTTMFKMQGAAEQTARTQESFHYQKDRQKNHSHMGKEINGSPSAAKPYTGVTSNGSQNGPNYQADDHHITELCQRVFLNVLVSEKFTSLCKLLFENFQGIKVDRFFDFSVINSRMKEGFYEQSPTHFSADIQQAEEQKEESGCQARGNA